MTHYTLRDRLKMVLDVCDEALTDPLTYYDPFAPKLMNFQTQWGSRSTCSHCGRSHSDQTCPGCGAPKQ